VTSVHEEYLRRLADPSVDSHAHMGFMHDVVTSCRNPVVIELGVAHCNTTSVLLDAVEQVEGELWSCDLPDAEHLKVPPVFRESERWHLLLGDDTSQVILDQMPGTCDVLFVDSDHTTEHVLTVMKAYMPRVRPGGYALFHDTEWEYPSTQLPWPGGEVAIALGRYCKGHGLTWENRPGSYGLGVIRP
jgi:cephalosporin hydroxylase